MSQSTGRGKRRRGGGDKGSVGRNVQRTEGVEKVTGRARYLDDLTFPDMLFGATVRSSIPRGRVRAVERDPNFDWSGFTIADASDIPGRNLVSMIVEDQPLLATTRVNHREEPLLLLAHADRGRLADGIAAVRVVYEAEPAVLTLDEATEVMKEITIEKGNLEAGFAEAQLIIEGSYRTGHQEQLYIEPNGVIAVPGEPDGGMTIFGSMQCPYYVVSALEKVLDLPAARLRVVQTTTGGGFGGKEEYPSILACHAALLARKAGRPVKMVYDRHEDLLATTKRHPSLIRHRTGVRSDGTLTAVEIDLRLDAGAYVTLSPVVLSRAAIHATGPYRVPHVRIRARAMKTNTPPNGAFRGFGAPQSQFAAESQMDKIAVELGVSPVALRIKNLLRAGDETATGQLLTESVSAEAVLDRALALAAGWKAPPGDGKLRGVGISTYFHGAGFTGGGEIKLASKAGLQLLPDGVRILVASTEIGQGTRTMHAQIVADTLGIPYEWVQTGDPDTQLVPDSGPTVASRTCMVVGRILQSAARQLKEALGPWPQRDDADDDPREFRRRARRHLEEHGPLTVIAEYERPDEMRWSDESYRGDAYGAYAWGANVAEVEVDPVTWQARCTRLVSVVDVGKAIHPLLVEGQIEGGSLQAVGWALYEEVVMRDGHMANGQLTNYIIPTTLDTPEMIVGLVENPYRHGPFGAKGVGEAPMDGPAPAIVAALREALGVRIDEVPATPERIMERVLAASAKEVAA